jgi:hypothetical protein
MKTHKDEFHQARQDADKLNKAANTAIDGLCIIACLLLFVAFVLGTLSLS